MHCGCESTQNFGISKIFDPHFIDEDVAVIGLTLDILHYFNK